MRRIGQAAQTISSAMKVASSVVSNETSRNVAAGKSKAVRMSASPSPLKMQRAAAPQFAPERSGDEVAYGGDHGIGSLSMSQWPAPLTPWPADVSDATSLACSMREGGRGFSPTDEQRMVSACCHAGESSRHARNWRKYSKPAAHGRGLCVRPALEPAISLGHGALRSGGEVVPKCSR